MNDVVLEKSRDVKAKERIEKEKVELDYYQSDLYDIFLSDRKKVSGKWHHYFPVYDWHLSRFKGTKPTIVEVGIAGGGSLEIWRKYFGPDARIIGVDINPRCKSYEEDGFEIYIGDQSDPEFLKELAHQIGTADVVIDDGGHTAVHCINTFQALYPIVSDSGVFITEDTHTAILPRYVDTMEGTTFIDMAKGLAEKLTWWHITPNNYRYKQPPSSREGEVEVPPILRNVWGVSFYDSMVVFEKRFVPEPWNDRR